MNIKTLLVASNNKHKIIEIKEILKELNLSIISLNEANIDVEIDETGMTFEENALLKAKGIYNIIKNKEEYMVLSDDSGLEVEALNNEPSIYSARYAGEERDDKKNIKKLLKKMENIKNIENRSAKFVCSMVLIDGNDAICVSGEVKGYITFSEKGQNGFGYDPIFYVPEYEKTFGELSDSEKNSISHRRVALKNLLSILKSK